MCSAIRDYSMAKNGVVNDNGEPITNENLLAFLKEMRDERIRDERQNRYLLEIIRRQSKPVFLRDVGANLTAATIFEALLCVGSELLNNNGGGQEFRLLTPNKPHFTNSLHTLLSAQMYDFNTAGQSVDGDFFHRLQILPMKTFLRPIQ